MCSAGSHMWPHVSSAASRRGPLEPWHPVFFLRISLEGLGLPYV